MQNRNFLFLIFTLFCGLALLTSCAPPQVGTTTGDLKTPIVKLHVSASKKLHITTSSSAKCKRSKDPNCIMVPHLDEALIGFELTPSSGWRFTEFKICVGDAKDTQVCELNEYQQVEFDASLSGGTTILQPNEFGVIDLKPLSPDLTKAFTSFNVLDHNWVKKDYFYSIKVCPIGTTTVDCIWTDPPIENGGRGGRVR